MVSLGDPDWITNNAKYILACRGVGISEDPGPQPLCRGDGNPIDRATGVKIQPEMDYSGPDGLTFQRTYRSSLGQFTSVLNSGWTQPSVNPLTGLWTDNRSACHPDSYTFNNETHPYCFPYAGTSGGTAGFSPYTLNTPDGQSLVFTDPSGTGAPIAKADTNIQALRNPDPATQYDWMWELVREDDSHERYSEHGQLVEKWPRQGQALKIRFTYSDANTPATVAPRPGLLIRMTNPFGRRLNFVYNALGQMVSMTDPAGGVYAYTYDDANNPARVTYPDQSSRTYLYNEPAYTSGANLPHALTGIVDETGVRYATFQYDATGKAISTEHAGGVDKYSFAYNNGTATTTVTDPLNTARTYTYTPMLGVKRNSGVSQPGGSGCAASASAVAYDSHGNPTSRTDFKGIQTTYVHDLTRNLETRRTEAAGTPEARTLTTQWHPLFRLPTQIAEPGRTTTYTYDGQGNRLGKTVTDTATGQARTWTWTYNAYGRVLTEDGPRTDVNTSPPTPTTTLPATC